MTRFDFGTWLLLMHYAQCWTRERGPATLVVFIPNSHVVADLAKHICPNVELIVFNNPFSRAIFFLFRRELVQYFTLNPIYAHACCQWPQALYIFDMTFSRTKPENIASYISCFDPVLKTDWPFSATFRRTYIQIREQYDYRRPVYQDMISLFYKTASKQLPKPSFLQELRQLFDIESPYVVMNLNCKDYRNNQRNNRRINHPERYNGLIDLLISKGYSVVLQGRNEQPHFTHRKGLVNYFSSPHVSPAADFKVYSNAAFAILPKTGPEVFGTICNIPVLGLNYTELSAIVPKSRCRFYPKHLWDTRKNEFIHWKELLQRPCFYDVGTLSFEPGIEYVEMSEEELIDAGEEFLGLLSQPYEQWNMHSHLQEEFKKSLHPAHIDLYDVTEVPCNAYLASRKYSNEN